jgi:hypothetical protein
MGGGPASGLAGIGSPEGPDREWKYGTSRAIV